MWSAGGVRIEGTITRPQAKKKKSDVSEAQIISKLSDMTDKLKSFERDSPATSEDDLETSVDDLLKAFKGML